MRQCGSCQLCCKLLPVLEIDKPSTTRCKHQKFGKGCAIYRKPGFPASCALWSCEWLAGGIDVLRPDHGHYVVDIAAEFITIKTDDGSEPDNHVPVVQVWIDPSYPDAHREPKLRAYLEENGKQGHAAIIRYNSHDAFVLFPPSLSADGQWHEVCHMAPVKHSMADIAAVMAGNRDG